MKLRSLMITSFCLSAIIGALTTTVFVKPANAQVVGGIFWCCGPPNVPGGGILGMKEFGVCYPNKVLNTPCTAAASGPVGASN
jgi:hypothetical protein